MIKGIKDNNIKLLVERKALLDALRAHYQPHDKQKLILDAIKQGYKKIFVVAGRQSGKTQESCDVSWAVAGLSHNKVCSIITPTLKQAKKIYWKKGTIQRFGPRNWIAKEQNDDLTLFFKNGSYIELDGSDNIDAHRGDKKDLVVLDEYKDIDERFYPEVIEPMFSTTQGIAILIGTPPETPESHFKEMDLHSQNDPTWANIRWTSYDSPYTSKEWLDDKRREAETRGELDVFKREYLGEYTVGGKNSVFIMFSRHDHVKRREVVQAYFDKIKDRCELYWINDPGTSTVFGGLFIAYYRDRGQLIFLNEIYSKDKSQTHTEAIVELAKQKVQSFEPDLKRWDIAYDDAAVWFQNELQYKFGLASRPAKKQSVEKEDGIALAKSMMLKKNSVIISEDCENFIREIENYIMVNGKYPKANDHLIDCWRYGMTVANVIVSLAENQDLLEDGEDFLDEYMYSSNKGLYLPSYIQ